MRRSKHPRAFTLLLALCVWTTAYAQITPSGNASTNTVSPTTNLSTKPLFDVTAAGADAQTCNFVTSGLTMTLSGDCVTSSTITIPDGFTLDGDGHLITAVDPDPNNAVYFSGAVVASAFGANPASVKNLIIDAPNLAMLSDVIGQKPASSL